jgi:hypothetical protein
MEKGTIILHLLDTDTTITIPQVFSYMKKKSMDQKDQMMLCSYNLDALKILTNYKGLLTVAGRTTSNKKHPKGLCFSASKVQVVRANKRLGYCEYLFVCEDNIVEE